MPKCSLGLSKQDTEEEEEEDWMGGGGGGLGAEKRTIEVIPIGYQQICH